MTLLRRELWRAGGGVVEVSRWVRRGQVALWGRVRCREARARTSVCGVCRVAGAEPAQERRVGEQERAVLEQQAGAGV